VSFILNIDTAVQTSSVCLAQDDQPLIKKINPTQKDSASWLHIAIGQALNEARISFNDLDAVAVSEGPGSYTGLRVGMAAAKGICYALNKPLIGINTLKMMAVAAQTHAADLLCPMIDARRMEVFTAVFSRQLDFLMPPTNLVLNESSFFELLRKNTVLFFGNGSTKFQTLTKNPNSLFSTIETNALHMTTLSYNKFLKAEFADLAYSQPYYGKDFYSSSQQSL